MDAEPLYFKCSWPEEPLPLGAPSWIFYEVIELTDVVTRTIELFPSGSAIRNSIKLAEREGPDLRTREFRSLVHGSFLGFSKQGLVQISKQEFNALWESAVDKPWPPEAELLC
ncbi:hypothetical protein K3725_05305 [Leisingera sp. S132]|uniref:hypothetical protein n=1 Tax=Leisingera sp. S132 TaxID=2867016 RepID=UPI0021A4A49C|nr:hypothetical protein [Leisingera sp. S132]UWQ80421.1 hypothetical protein K3725_05305 [Leisingera sp. S132]